VGYFVGENEGAVGSFVGVEVGTAEGICGHTAISQDSWVVCVPSPLYPTSPHAQSA
jgi:hypothetical protein